MKKKIGAFLCSLCLFLPILLTGCGKKPTSPVVNSELNAFKEMATAIVQTYGTGEGGDGVATSSAPKYGYMSSVEEPLYKQVHNMLSEYEYIETTDSIASYANGVFEHMFYTAIGCGEVLLKSGVTKLYGTVAFFEDNNTVASPDGMVQTWDSYFSINKEGNTIIITIYEIYEEDGVYVDESYVYVTIDYVSENNFSCTMTNYIESLDYFQHVYCDSDLNFMSVYSDEYYGRDPAGNIFKTYDVLASDGVDSYITTDETVVKAACDITIPEVNPRQYTTFIKSTKQNYQHTIPLNKVEEEIAKFRDKMEDFETPVPLFDVKDGVLVNVDTTSTKEILTIPNNVTAIMVDNLYVSTSVKKIIIPSSVKKFVCTRYYYDHWRYTYGHISREPQWEDANARDLIEVPFEYAYDSVRNLFYTRKDIQDMAPIVEAFPNKQIVFPKDSTLFKEIDSCISIAFRTIEQIENDDPADKYYLYDVYDYASYFGDDYIFDFDGDTYQGENVDIDGLLNHLFPDTFHKVKNELGSRIMQYSKELHIKSNNAANVFFALNQLHNMKMWDGFKEIARDDYVEELSWDKVILTGSNGLSIPVNVKEIKELVINAHDDSYDAWVNSVWQDGEQNHSTIGSITITGKNIERFDLSGYMTLGQLTLPDSLKTLYMWCNDVIYTGSTINIPTGVKNIDIVGDDTGDYSFKTTNDFAITVPASIITLDIGQDTIHPQGKFVVNVDLTMQDILPEDPAHPNLYLAKDWLYDAIVINPREDIEINTIFSMLVDGLDKVSDTSYEKKYANATTTVNIGEMLTLSPNSSYKIYKDLNGAPLSSDVVTLAEGANVYYIVQTADDSSQTATYSVELYRNRIVSVNYVVVGAEGISIPTQTVEEGSELALTIQPDKKELGYASVGYFADAAGTKPILTEYQDYIIKVDDWTNEYYSYVSYGDSRIDASHEYYNIYSYKIPKVSADNLTIYAVYKPKIFSIYYNRATHNLDGEFSYWVSYTEHEEDALLSFTIDTEASSFVLDTAPTLKGYTFVAWYSDEERQNPITSISFESLVAIAGNDSMVFLYADFDLDIYDVVRHIPVIGEPYIETELEDKYNVLYQQGFNLGYFSFYVDEDEDGDVDPIYYWYKFDGWYFDKDYTDPVVYYDERYNQTYNYKLDTSIYAEDIEVWAKITCIEYDIRYMDSYGDVIVDTYTHENITPLRTYLPYRYGLSYIPDPNYGWFTTGDGWDSNYDTYNNLEEGVWYTALPADVYGDICFTANYYFYDTTGEEVYGKVVAEREVGDSTLSISFVNAFDYSLVEGKSGDELSAAIAGLAQKPMYDYTFTNATVSDMEIPAFVAYSKNVVYEDLTFERYMYNKDDPDTIIDLFDEEYLGVDVINATTSARKAAYDAVVNSFYFTDGDEYVVVYRVSDGQGNVVEKTFTITIDFYSEAVSSMRRFEFTTIYLEEDTILVICPEFDMVYGDNLYAELEISYDGMIGCRYPINSKGEFVIDTSDLYEGSELSLYEYAKSLPEGSCLWFTFYTFGSDAMGYNYMLEAYCL